ncbi:MAG TPA: GNAT family N-acetyltransferase [Anaerolineales bacterium]|nr:GNAT family N-acetyltransferase [Anaerolineales bacterium]
MIFPATEADGPQIINVTRRIDIFTQQEVDSVKEAWEEYMAYGSPPDGYYFLVYRDGDKVLGFTCFGIRYLAEGVYDLFWIAVDPDARRKGVGGALITSSEEAVRAMGGRILIAETSGTAEYQSTREFYVRMGYDNEATIKDFYKPSDDLKIYTKRL